MIVGAVTNLSGLLQGNSLNHQENFCYLNCFNSYISKNKLKEHEEICNNHDSCRIEMPEWVNKILKHNPGEKSLKAPFTIYIDSECTATKIINYERKEMIPLTHEENNFYNEQEVCYISKEKFCTNKNNKNYINKREVKDHCHYTGKFRGTAHSKCNLNSNNNS